MRSVSETPARIQRTIDTESGIFRDRRSLLVDVPSVTRYTIPTSNSSRCRRGIDRQTLSRHPAALGVGCGARVLGRRVEDLFRLADDHPRVPAELVGEARAVDGTVMRRGQIATIQDRP